jgi:glutathione peroxidase
MTTKISVPIVLLLMLALAACGNDSDKPEPGPEASQMDETGVQGNSYQEIPLETINGDTTKLSDFAGKVVLLVNTASECGFTPQYDGLEELHRKYSDSGLVVIGFPANNFGNQEPGTNEEIFTFCRTKFDVTFPMMAKISVKGDDKHPLYVYLTEKSSYAGEIKWNFTKFLLDRDGKPVARFEPSVEPLSDELVEYIEKLLQ